LLSSFAVVIEITLVISGSCCLT